jgi:hypothetical protein
MEILHFILHLIHQQIVFIFPPPYDAFAAPIAWLLGVAPRGVLSPPSFPSLRALAEL